MEEDFQNLSLSDGNSAASTAKDQSALSGMSDVEISQHLEHCMKLAAENKITMKNAFGLKLINILQRMVKNSPDLSFASLSLQASAKIFASRIDALYNETVNFHGHLQTIVGGKKGKDKAQDDEDATTEADAQRQRRKRKSYMCSEESVTQQKTSLRPTRSHENYQAVVSAFSGSRTTKPLVDCLKFSDDLCEISCALPLKCFQDCPQSALGKAVKFPLPQKVIDKVAKMNDQLELCNGDDTCLSMANKSKFSMDDVFSSVAGSPPHDPGVNDDFDAGDVAGTINGFERLAITPQTLAGDLSAALVRRNTTTVGRETFILDQRLLPPESVLRVTRKRVVAAEDPAAEGTKKKETVKKTRGPFFGDGSFCIDESKFAKGKKTRLTDAVLLEKFTLEKTTVLSTGHDKFFNTLASFDEPHQNLKPHVILITELLYGMDYADESRNPLKSRFVRKPKQWQLHRAAYGGPAPDRRSLYPRNDPECPEGLTDSFRQLSMQDSFGCDSPGLSGNCLDSSPLRLGGADSPRGFLTESPLRVRPSLNSSFADIEPMLVAPPDLVKPLSIHYASEPATFDMGVVKKCAWEITSHSLDVGTEVRFSDVCKSLDKALASRGLKPIPDRLAFLVILILSNEKVLSLENVADSREIIIRQDVLEE